MGSTSKYCFETFKAFRFFFKGFTRIQDANSILKLHSRQILTQGGGGEKVGREEGMVERRRGRGGDGGEEKGEGRRSIMRLMWEGWVYH